MTQTLLQVINDIAVGNVGEVVIQVVTCLTKFVIHVLGDASIIVN